MRPEGSPEELEARRRRAIYMMQDGKSAVEVADKLGTTSTSVRRWWRAFEKDGIDALDARPATGGPRKLSDEQLRHLGQMLKLGPKAHGYPVNHWSAELIQIFIEQEFGVRYHPASINRLLPIGLVSTAYLHQWRPWMDEH